MNDSNMGSTRDGKTPVIIAGCGVSGLTCGLRLLQDGYDVRIVADKMPPNITSNIAAAYWYPYKVSPKEKVLEWAGFSYSKFLELSGIEGTGVRFTQLIKFFDHKIEDPFWSGVVRNFRREITDIGIHEYIDGFTADIPVIETPVYMQYLIDEFRDLGGTVEKLDCKLENLGELAHEERLIVNCTGLGSRELCDDLRSYPIRGQIVRTTNPGLKKILSDEEGPLGLSYIVPRSKDCVLGGTSEENDWNLSIDQKTADEIVRKCTTMEPELKKARVIEHLVGLRPGRDEVCLEAEEISPDCTVIHNYGHGGAGFTLSWGCAEDVVKLVKEAENKLANT